MIPTLSSAAASVWAKSTKDDSGWLPLWRHLADSAGVAGRLWDEWLPRSVRALISQSLPGGEADGRRLLVWLAGVHDLGKATPAFAHQVRPLADQMRKAGLDMPDRIPIQDRKLVPHALAGHLLLEEWLTDTWGWPRAAARQVAVVVGGHHGVPPEREELRRARDHESYLGLARGQEAWQRVHQELLEWTATQWGVRERLADWREVTLPPPVQVLLTGAVIVADWVASNRDLFPYELDTLHSPRRIDDAWEALDLPTPWQAVPVTSPVDSLFRNRFRLTPEQQPYPVQAAAVQIALGMADPGLMIIEAPMGEGKTEAALAAAEILAATTGAGGCFLALPTRATSDAAFPRMLNWLERVPDADRERGVLAVGLAHGKARFHTDFQDLMKVGRSVGIELDGEPQTRELAAHRWLSGRKKALLSSFVVGTIDQLLFAALKSRHLALRHLGLAGKVVIIDEAHAYDVYMSQYLDRALEWLAAYRVPTIVLSATLPGRRRKEMLQAYERGRQPAQPAVRHQPSWKTAASAAPTQAPPDPYARVENERGYPVITATTASGQPSLTVTEPSGRRVEVSLERLDDDLPILAERLRTELSDGGCVLVIRNTVRRVQETAAFLRHALPDVPVAVAHSRFLAPDRAKKDQWLRQKFGPPEHPDGRSDLRPATQVVVASQVAEQSLDIDFDLLITDVAPVDLLLQRMGRLHRHPRGEGQRWRPPRLRRARCLLTGADWTTTPPTPVAGSVRVYDRHHLLRALAVLSPYLEKSQPLRLPDDISLLVQSAYHDDPIGPAEWQDTMQEAYAQHRRHQRDKQSAATVFRLGSVGADREPILGWLAAGVGDADDDVKGRQQVRDTAGETLEVSVLIRRADGVLTLPPWLDEHGGVEVPVAHEPPGHLARAVAACTLALPAPLCTEQVIRELETTIDLSAWRQNRLLSGELVLALDEAGHATVADHQLHYDPVDGLTVDAMDKKTQVVAYPREPGSTT